MRKSSKQAEQWGADKARTELRLWQGSGQTMEAFSSKRGYPAHRLSWWKRQLRLKGERMAQAGAGGTERQDERMVGAILEATVTGAGSKAAAVVDTGFGVRIEVANTERVAPSWVAAVAAQLSRGG